MAEKKYRSIDEITHNGVPLREILEAHRAWVESHRHEGRRANLSKAEMGGDLLMRADLSEADLGRADLSGVILWYANLTRANLAAANLAGADLAGASLFEVNL